MTHRISAVAGPLASTPRVPSSPLAVTPPLLGRRRPPHLSLPRRIAESSPTRSLSRGTAGRRRPRRRAEPPPLSPHLLPHLSLFLAALSFLFLVRIKCCPRWKHRQLRKAVHSKPSNPTSSQNVTDFMQRQVPISQIYISYLVKFAKFV